jgi:16S rRNA (cytosine967-C5)-methyltransferase
MDARAIAAKVLVAVEQGGRSQECLSRALDADRRADPRDRGLATELTYGVLRQALRLDRALEPHLRRPVGELEPLVRALCRVGAFQILFLDRIPGPIAVSATQDTARRVGMGRVAGLLNAVLRKVVEQGESLPGGPDHAAIAHRASLPEWIIAELELAYGAEDLEKEALALRERSSLYARPIANRGGLEAAVAALAEEGFEARAGPYGSLRIEGKGDPFATRAFREGRFVPQDPGSLAVIDSLGDVSGKRVLDLCAGRGIKATALADRGARVVAMDIDGKKLDEASRLAARLGLEDQVETVVLDATAGPPPGAPFELVLIDAPCSGLGTLRRRPEIAWRRVPADLPRLAELQAKLVEAGARSVAPGGVLSYAVCSFARIEGSPQVPCDFRPLDPPLLLRPSSGLDAFQVQAWRRVG